MKIFCIGKENQDFKFTDFPIEFISFQAETRNIHDIIFRLRLSSQQDEATIVHTHKKIWSQIMEEEEEEVLVCEAEWFSAQRDGLKTWIDLIQFAPSDWLWINVLSKVEKTIFVPSRPVSKNYFIKKSFAHDMFTSCIPIHKKDYASLSAKNIHVQIDHVYQLE